MSKAGKRLIVEHGGALSIAQEGAPQPALPGRA
jgi:hypothetical protein